ncbi:MAG TPA: VC0807 family protein [Solirubrobacteraceae bacterium]|nr:VC0807 family protein [Solirubrobacteraceae bacterium]
MNGATATEEENRRRALVRRARLRLLAGVGVPVAVYVVLRITLHSETAALAITETLPVAWVLAVGVRRGRVDPIAVVAAIVLGVALIVSIAMGGSALPLKLRRSVVTGSIGIACLVSVVIGRPLLPFVLDLLRRSLPQSKRLAEIVGADSALRRKWLVLTAIIGVTLLCDAAAQLTLALTVSTDAFVGTSRLARTGLFALGIAVCALYLRRTSGRPAPVEEPASEPRTPVAVGQGAE